VLKRDKVKENFHILSKDKTNGFQIKGFDDPNRNAPARNIAKFSLSLSVSGM
jgi:hypothetical protein